jgi:hypothetical protein
MGHSETVLVEMTTGIAVFVDDTGADVTVGIGGVGVGDGNGVVVRAQEVTASAEIHIKATRSAIVFSIVLTISQFYMVVAEAAQRLAQPRPRKTTHCLGKTG